MKKENRKGIPDHVIEKIIDIHEQNGTLDKLLDSGVGEQVKETLIRTVGFLSGSTAPLGYEPFIYDSGLRLLADVAPGSSSSFPTGFSTNNADLYFLASPTSDNFKNLFRIDGETLAVAEIDILSIDSDAQYNSMSVVGGKLFITGSDSNWDGVAGRNITITYDLTTGAVSEPIPDAFVFIDYRTLFEVGDYHFAEGYTREEGIGFSYPVLVRIHTETGSLDIVETDNTGAALVSTLGAFEIGGGAYVGMYSAEYGYEPYYIDGATGEVTLVDLVSGPDSSGGTFFGPQVLFNEKSYFVALDTGFSGNTYLYSFDSDENVSLEYNSSIVQSVAFAFGDWLFLNTSNGVTRLDELGSPTNLNVLNGYSSSSIQSYGEQFEFNGDLYFNGSIDGASNQLLKIEGDTGNLELVYELRIGVPANPRDFHVFGGDLYFTAYDEFGEGAINNAFLFSIDGETGELREFDFILNENSSATDREYVDILGVVEDELLVASFADLDGDGTGDSGGYVLMVADGSAETIDDFEVQYYEGELFSPGQLLLADTFAFT